MSTPVRQSSQASLPQRTEGEAATREPVSVARFMRQRAVKVEAPGTYTLPNWYDSEGRLRSFACRTSRVSPFRMMVDVPVVGRIGDRLTSYFRDFGRFDGQITEVCVKLNETVQEGQLLFVLEKAAVAQNGVTPLELTPTT